MSHQNNTHTKSFVLNTLLYTGYRAHILESMYISKADFKLQHRLVHLPLFGSLKYLRGPRSGYIGNSHKLFTMAPCGFLLKSHTCSWNEIFQFTYPDVKGSPQSHNIAKRSADIFRKLMEKRKNIVSRRR